MFSWLQPFTCKCLSCDLCSRRNPNTPTPMPFCVIADVEFGKLRREWKPLFWSTWHAALFIHITLFINVRFLGLLCLNWFSLSPPSLLEVNMHIVWVQSVELLFGWYWLSEQHEVQQQSLWRIWLLQWMGLQKWRCCLKALCSRT